MNHHKFSQQMISIGLILLFLVGCSAPATPKAGHWEGKPSVSFEVGTDENIHDFKMEIDLGVNVGACTVTSDDITVEADGTFTLIFGEPLSEDENIILGKFESNIAVSGSRSKKIFCVNPSGQAVFGVFGGDNTWNAEWKGP